MHLRIDLCHSSLGLPLFSDRVGCHGKTCLESLISGVRLTCPYHVSCIFSISRTRLPSISILCVMISFLTWSFLEIHNDLRNASIYTTSTVLLCFFFTLQVSQKVKVENNEKILFIVADYMNCIYFYGPY